MNIPFDMLLAKQGRYFLIYPEKCKLFDFQGTQHVLTGKQARHPAEEEPYQTMPSQSEPAR